MKNSLFIFFILTLLLFSGNRGVAQEQYKLTAGIGLPELLNLGLRIQFEQTQVGLALGAIPWEDEQNFALSANFYYHFGGSSELTSLKPWFISTGVTYMQYEDKYERQTTFFFVPRIGREFNITSKFGVALELGGLIVLVEEIKIKRERPVSWFEFDLDFGNVLPSGGLNIFYRL